MPRGLVISAAALGFMGGCAKAPEDFTILTTTPAPAGDIRALLVEDRSGGPATGVSYDVYLIRNGERLRFHNRVFGKEEIENVRLRWTTPRRLLVTYFARPSADNDAGLVRPAFLAFQNPFGVRVVTEQQTSATYARDQPAP
jgi:hypothetical protein